AEAWRIFSEKRRRLEGGGKSQRKPTHRTGGGRAAHPRGAICSFHFQADAERPSLMSPRGVIKSGCGLSSWKWGQECPQNPQAGKPALRSADILVCGFGRLSSRLSLTHF